MKRFVLAFVVGLMALTGMAQKAGSFNERLFEAKVAEMTYRLKLTDKQVAEFRPIYEDYNKEMVASWKRPERRQQPVTSEEVAAQMKQRMERQQQAQAVRIKYADRFAKVLSAKQLEQFFKVENEIQKRLRARKARAAGKARGSKARR